MPGWTRASFRRLMPWEADGYAAHLKALTPDGRRRRFCGMVSDGVLDAHACHAIETGYVEGCFLDGHLIGAFELFVDPLPPNDAQVALSVDAAHGNNGLGAELIHRARSRASMMGAAQIELQMQGDNAAMIALARRAGAPIIRNGTELEAAVAVSRPDLRRLPLVLMQDEASLLRALSSSVARAARRAAARAVTDYMQFLSQRWRGGLTRTPLQPTKGW